MKRAVQNSIALLKIELERLFFLNDIIISVATLYKQYSIFPLMGYYKLFLANISSKECPRPPSLTFRKKLDFVNACVIEHSNHFC